MQEKHVLVTGGTGALGRAVTKKFAERGATVYVPFLDAGEKESLDHLFKDLGLNARVRWVAADLTRAADVERVVSSMPQVDAVAHLVGGFAMGAFETFHYEEWLKLFELNVHTAFLVCQSAASRMRARGYGRIVTVSSSATFQPPASMAAYAASKAALVAMTRSLAEEFRSLDITANCLAPSTIDTPANRRAMGEEVRHTWVSPDSIAEVVYFLASDAARDMRGSVIPMNGRS